MDKARFLKRLRELLACLPESEVDEAVSFYAEAIEDRMADGMTEQEAVLAIGTPGTVADEILDSLPAVPRTVVKTRRRSPVLLWVLAVLGSPLWLVLLASFLLVVASVYACIWIMAGCLWILAAACAGTLLLALLASFWGILVGNAPFVIAVMGLGIALGGAGILIGQVALTASRQLARLSRAWLRGAWSLFRNDHSRYRRLQPPLMSMA